MSRASEKLPSHLKQYITKQDYSVYTEIDQAVWRFIMMVSVPFFKKNAHPIYLKGLKQTGIPLDKIPRVEDMDKKLDSFGWGAVAVQGFIPPSAFMELLSRKVLAIAIDIRTAEHIAYTSAPDIIHESAGHAPIIADKDYANYLSNYGEIAKKAIASKEDLELYEIIREMSDLKENPNADKKDIETITEKFIKCSSSISWISEASKLARMNWWSAEYGLIGSIDDPKIYGAGLLSSVGESNDCLLDKVKKIPFTLDCIKYEYDITEPQPQLFVTESFQNLNDELFKFSENMAYKLGGSKGLSIAKKAQSINTVVIDSGLQISGLLLDYIMDNKNEPIYLQFSGPTQLSFNDQELKGHSKNYHKDGFGSALGKLKTINKSLFECNKSELEIIGIYLNNEVDIYFKSNLRVRGKVIEILYMKDSPLLISIQSCTIELNDEILFDPSWGTYDLCCGSQVHSVFGGPADWKNYYSNNFRKKKNSTTKNISPDKIKLKSFFEKINQVRLGNLKINICKKVYDEVRVLYPDEWLILVEIFLIVKSNGKMQSISDEIIEILTNKSKEQNELGKIISRGIEALQS
tara:strand:+ start:8029 stop:9759 length:1731 start_codon:yes stop_codon:yes gene_type:complete